MRVILFHDKRDLLSGIVLASFGSFLIYEAQRLPYRSEFGPGPGFLPLWIGIGIVACSAVMPMSDHCDYKELVDAVKQCRPEKVYTFHGFAAEFAKSLRQMGYDAEPVGEKSENASLDSFQ